MILVVFCDLRGIFGGFTPHEHRILRGAPKAAPAPSNQMEAGQRAGLALPARLLLLLGYSSHTHIRHYTQSRTTVDVFTTPGTAREVDNGTRKVKSVMSYRGVVS